MEQNDQRFALIFQKNREKYELDVAALLDYDEETKEYTVHAGKYKGDDRGDFSLLVGDPSFIYGKGIDLYLEEQMGVYAPYIYIFDPKDIEAIAKEKNLTIEQTYHHIINKVNMIKLLDIGGHEYKSIFSMKSKIIPYTNEDMLNMLYDEKDNKNEYDIDIPMPNYTNPFLSLFGLDDDKREQPKKEEDSKTVDEKFQDELTKAIEDISKNLGISVKVGVIGKDILDPPHKTSKSNLDDIIKKIDNKDLVHTRSNPTSVDEILKEVRERKEAKEKMKQIDVEEMIDEISKKIVGQDEAIKTLVANICFNQKLIDAVTKDGKTDKGELDARKISILLDGSTGTGKTAIIKEIAAMLSLPVKIVNANSFSETGYVGPTITDVLKDLLEQADGDMEIAQRGIIVFDEIDKLATNASYSGKDMKQGVQEELLGFISGGEYEISSGSGFLGLGSKEQFDTSGLTFILSGAFTSMRDKKIKEATTSSIGFSGSDEEEKKEYEVTPQDYIDFGLMREFFGRIKVLSNTNTYTEEDLKKILLESSISPLKNFEKTVQMYGYKGISYDDEFIDAVCKEAHDMETGARALQTIMSGIQNKMLLGLTVGEYNREEPITLSVQNIEDYKQGNIRSY